MVMWEVGGGLKGHPNSVDSYCYLPHSSASRQRCMQPWWLVVLPSAVVTAAMRQQTLRLAVLQPEALLLWEIVRCGSNSAGQEKASSPVLQGWLPCGASSHKAQYTAPAQPVLHRRQHTEQAAVQPAITAAVRIQRGTALQCMQPATSTCVLYQGSHVLLVPSCMCHAKPVQYTFYPILHCPHAA